jgi:hypothetical protein
MAAPHCILFEHESHQWRCSRLEVLSFNREHSACAHPLQFEQHSFEQSDACSDNASSGPCSTSFLLRLLWEDRQHFCLHWEVLACFVCRPEQPAALQKSFCVSAPADPVVRGFCGCHRSGVSGFSGDVRHRTAPAEDGADGR